MEILGLVFLSIFVGNIVALTGALLCGLTVWPNIPIDTVVSSISSGMVTVNHTAAQKWRSSLIRGRYNVMHGIVTSWVLHADSPNEDDVCFTHRYWGLAVNQPP